MPTAAVRSPYGWWAPRPAPFDAVVVIIEATEVIQAEG